MKPIGKYEVIAEIGTGAMGTIYRARDQVLDRDVALKVLRTDADLDPELKERFYREARACARLGHPNIITVYDLGEADGSVYIAMELLSGSDLRKVLQEERPFSMAERLEVMVQVCDALEHAHRQQLVHRDIKPSNIFLCDDQRAKVLDFGIARIPMSNLTIAGKVLGSPNYMAPEQIRGGKCDSRSDLFSAAIVFCEFLVRAHPFQDEFIPRRIVASPPDSLRRRDPQIPEALEALLFSGLEKDPDKRIRTAGEFAAGLRSILEPLRPAPVLTTPSPPPPAQEAPQPAQGINRPVEENTDLRVSEFLRLVFDFDEAIDQRDPIAARAALEKIRRQAATDSQFDQAVSDCEAKLSAMTGIQGGPPPPQPAVLSSSPSEPARLAPKQPELPVPRKVEPARPVTPPEDDLSPKKNLTVLALVAGLVILLAISFWVRNRIPAGPAAPIRMEAEVATATVSAPTTSLLGAADASGKPIAVLKQGQAVNVLAIPDAGNREYTRVQPANVAAGFVRTADLSNWTGKDAEAAFSLVALFAPAETSGESELNAQVEKWNRFVDQFPSSPRIAAAHLESARLELALAKIGKSAGKPAAEWQSHNDRAKLALAGVTGSPGLESQAAQLRLQLEEPTSPPITPPVTPPVTSQPPERILRTRVNSLWEDGKYQQAMYLVDQILAAAPNHEEALIWKRKIRASQEAEARAQ